VTVAALAASRTAAEAVLESGGRLVPISALVRENPKGTNVKIVI